MVRKLACFLALILISMAAVSAATDIKIKSLPLRNISVLIFDANQVYSLDTSYHTSTNINGNANVTYTGSISKINIGVKINQDNIYHLFDDKFDAGQQINLNVIPGEMSSSTGKTEEENVTENITENATESNLTEDVVSNTTGNESKKGFLSGLSISEFTKKFKIVYYIIGIIVVAGIVFLFIKFKGQIFKRDIAYNYKSLSNKDLSKELVNAENKLKEAQNEINKLKNKDRIDTMERKIEQDKLELEKLKDGKI